MKLTCSKCRRELHVAVWMWRRWGLLEVLILEVGKCLYTFSSLSVVMLITVSQTHRMAEAGTDLWRSSGPTSSPQAGPGRVNCSGSCQVTFKDFQGSIMHSLFVWPVPMFHHPYSEKLFPGIQEEPPVFHLVSTASHQATLRRAWLHSFSTSLLVSACISKIPFWTISFPSWTASGF